MARRTVEVLPVGPDEVGELTGLWLASRVDSGISQEVASRAAADGRLATAIERGDVEAHLARIDGVACGFVVTSENPFGLCATPELAIELLYVESSARRHGVAKTLLATVLGHAERTGCEVVVSNVPSQSREANRFFARLGFGAVLVRRVSTTAQLRRKLSPEVGEGGLEVLRRRRSLRTRALGGPTRPRSA